LSLAERKQYGVNGSLRLLTSTQNMHFHRVSVFTVIRKKWITYLAQFNRIQKGETTDMEN